jgi:hypothetical protein
MRCERRAEVAPIATGLPAPGSTDMGVCAEAETTSTSIMNGKIKNNMFDLIWCLIIDLASCEMDSEVNRYCLVRRVLMN